MKLDILVMAAHPDDAELSCAGTILSHIAAGKKVGIVDFTRGELGTRGTPEIRLQESADATQILGIHARENLGIRDGFFRNDEETQLKLIEVIRKYQPELVLANALEDRHPDHGKGAQLAIDACFLSGLRKIETEHEGVQQEVWRPKVVYHYIQWKNIEPDFVVDISEFMDIKTKSILAYASQFYSENSNEPVTPIATKNFLESIHYRSQDFGRLIGVDYAEGFTTERYVAVKSLGDLI